MPNKELIRLKQKHGTDFIKFQLMFFRIMKIVIMLITFLFTFLIMRTLNTDFTEGSALEMSTSLYKLGVIALIVLSAWHVSVFVLDTYTKSAWSSLIVGVWIIYGISLIIYQSRITIVEPRQFLTLVNWGLFSLFVPLLGNIWSIIVNWRVSPLNVKYTFRKIVATFSFTLVIIFSYLLLYIYVIDVDNEFVEPGTPIYSNPTPSALIVGILIFTLIGNVAAWMAYFMYKKIRFELWSKDKVKIIYIPVFASVALWYMTSHGQNNFSWQTWIYLTICVLTVLGLGIYIFFGKGEALSPNIMVAVFGLAIMFVWILVFMFSSIYGYRIDRYTLVGISAVSTAIIFGYIGFVDTQFTKVQGLMLTVLISLLGASILGYWFINTTDIDLSLIPFDVEVMFLVNFALLPSIYLLVGVLGQASAITRLSSSFKKVERLKEKAKEVSQDEK